MRLTGIKYLKRLFMFYGGKEEAMEKINMMKWVDDAIAAEKKQGLLVLSFPAIQKMGITVRELVQSSDLQAQAMKIVADLTPEAWGSVSMMDLSLEAEAFGSQVVFSDDEVPTIVGSIVDDEESAEELEIPEIGAGRTQIYIDAIEKAAKLITDRPVFAGLLGPDLAQELSGDYVKKIVAATQEDDFLVIYHNCGNSVIPQIDSITTNGCRVLHFGNAIKMEDIMPLIPENIIAMGNVDPSSQFRNGTPESVKARTIEIMDKVGSFKNYVPSSGCDIPPMSPWENILAFFDGVNSYYAG